ncbi:MAG: hypothetical protein KC776_15030 [Myxococcales bacterium]|nr:hypothetical protein [Myxococcales bacterium]
MRRLLLGCALLLTGCAFSQQAKMRDACFQACASQKDDCMLRAMGPDAIRRCDTEGTNCSSTCH